MTDSVNDDVLFCSFCGKNQNTVHKLIAGPSVYICNECVHLCNDILTEEHQPNAEPEVLDDEADEDHLPTPKEIKEVLDAYVVGQEFAKKTLSVAVYNHYKRLKHQRDRADDPKRVEIAKSNILLIGPTGSGKTLLAETLARTLRVPFAIADATSLSEAGYVGEDVETIIQRLLQKCDYDIEKAQTGIIYIDEVDKIAKKSDSPSITRDVSGEGVQQALLKLIEGTVASIPPQGGRKHAQQDYLQVDTSNILFICGGAFPDLEKIIRDRSEKSGIGFAASLKAKSGDPQHSEMIKKVQPEDLIRYGLIPEFCGRLPIIATLEELSEACLVRILHEPHNALTKQYQALFGMEGVEIEFRESALQMIAKKALKRRSGARGLRSILESILLETMFELPSRVNLSKVVIDESVIDQQNEPILIYEAKDGVGASEDDVDHGRYGEARHD